MTAQHIPPSRPDAPKETTMPEATTEPTPHMAEVAAQVGRWMAEQDDNAECDTYPDHCRMADEHLGHRIVEAGWARP